LNALNIAKLRIAKFGLKKLETSFYGVTQSAFWRLTVWSWL